MKSAVWAALLPCVFLSMALDSAAQAPVGALAIDERRGDQWGWAVDYRTAAAAQEARARRVRPGLLGGVDVRSVRGVCGRSGRRQHGSGVG